MTHVLLIDNYDSFTQTIRAYCAMAGARVTVLLNDDLQLDDITALQVSHLIISPGPGNPDSAGKSLSLISQYHQSHPILGICLGHQCLAQYFGARVVPASRLMHGYSSAVFHTNEGLFNGLPSPMTAMRYHSLIVNEESLPDCLHITSWSNDNDIGKEVMAIQHSHWPLYGIQYHPEAALSEHGLDLIRAFLTTTPVCAAQPGGPS